MVSKCLFTDHCYEDLYNAAISPLRDVSPYLETMGKIVSLEDVAQLTECFLSMCEAWEFHPQHHLSLVMS